MWEKYGSSTSSMMRRTSFPVLVTQPWLWLCRPTTTPFPRPWAATSFRQGIIRAHVASSLSPSGIQAANTRTRGIPMKSATSIQCFAAATWASSSSCPGTPKFELTPM